MKPAYVYILTNKRNGTLYVGMSSCLSRRIGQHMASEQSSFVKKYQLDTLVYVERHDTIETAALRERQIKKWNRQWKLRLIEEKNPTWKDLTDLLA